MALGIELEHSRPAHPQDNGAHERLHKDIAAEVASKVQLNRRLQQAALDIWRDEYNRQRPHESLQDRFPAEVYHKSDRAYPVEPVLLDYGPGFFTRRVAPNGMITCHGQTVFLTQALSGWEIGLRLVAPEQLEVWFNYLLVGTINLKTNRFDSAPSRSVKAVSLAA